MSHSTAPITDPDNHLDEWFKHDSNEPHHQETHGQFNSAGIFITLLLTAFGTLGVSVTVILWTNHWVFGVQASSQEGSTRITSQRTEAFGAWKSQLHRAPEWIDQGAGVVSVPLETASRSVIGRYEQSGS